MKFTFVYIAALATLALPSCQEKPCNSYGIAGIQVETTDNSNIPDSTMRVVRFQKDGGFSKPIDSFERPISNYPSNFFLVRFNEVSATDYNFDCVCKMYPSGKTFAISHIYHENGKGKPGLSCVNAVHYTLNNTNEKVMGYLGMDGFVLGIKY